MPNPSTSISNPLLSNVLKLKSLLLILLDLTENTKDSFLSYEYDKLSLSSRLDWMCENLNDLDD